MFLVFALVLALAQTDAHEAHQRERDAQYGDQHGDWERRHARSLAAADACASIADCLAVLDLPDGATSPQLRERLGRKILGFGPAGRTALFRLAVDEQSYFAISALTGASDWTDAEIGEVIAAIGSNDSSHLFRLLASARHPLGDAFILDRVRAADDGYWPLTDAAKELLPGHWSAILDEWERRHSAGLPTFAIDDVFYEADPGRDVVLAIASETASNRRRSRRLAALAAIAAMGEAATDAEPALFRLAEDPDRELAESARLVLLRMGNTQFAAEIAAERCAPIDDAFAPHLHEVSNCPYFFFRGNPDAAIAAGEEIARLLDSPHAGQRSDAARVLSEAGDTRIVPRLRLMLTSDNWRDVNAALEALRRLEAVETIGDLRRLSAIHWHPYVRERASRAAEALETGAPADFPAGGANYSLLWAGSYPRPVCRSRRWTWQGTELPQITPQTAYRPQNDFGSERRLDLANGYLIGTDRGEWGGELVWHFRGGEPVMLLEHNVRAMLPYRDGALILTGLAHLGINEGAVYRVEVSQHGEPRIFQVAELPGSPAGGMAHVEDRLYAVSEFRSEDDPDGFVTVFDAEAGILGLADCVTD